jgi:GNAT superfamily N-acetyltransferase
VGIVCCYVDTRRGREIFIYFFEVEHTFRGQGYGREMAEWVEDYAWRLGVRKLALVAYGSAIDFWMKMGFTLHTRFDMAKVLRGDGKRSACP